MIKKILTAKFILINFLLVQNTFAQDFILQGWYWDYPKTASGYNWADTLTNKAQSLANAGFTYIWLPPFTRTSFGSSSNGYDPKDLFDLGEFGQGATQFGTRTDVDEVISSFTNAGLNAVADVVYNHRDGGAAENNGAVEGWIENFTSTKVNNGDNAFPSDRFRCYLAVGGATGKGAGTYYFKIKSASEHSNYFNKNYKVYMWTNTIGWQGLTDTSEVEPNGGGGCGESNNTITLGRNFNASVDGLGCKVDEFALTLSGSDFNAAGDSIYIVLSNSNGDYSDHYIYELWYNGNNIQPAIQYQTYTNFLSMPSGRGGMNYLNFKPNGNPTQLSGDWDWLWFFYDYDQDVSATRDTLFAWSRWLWNDVGIRGLRMDAVKHFPYSFTGDLLDNLHSNGIDPGLIVGEFFDANASTLKGWVDNVKSNMDAGTLAAISPRAFDFSLQGALRDACDAFGYDARNVFTSGMVDGAGASGFDAVTFINNHDFRDAGQYVDNDPILAYAYILTNNQIGMPCVFYTDYYNSGIKGKIDFLISIHKNYIYGATARDYLSRSGTPYAQNFISGFASTSLIYQIGNTSDGRDILVAINFAGDTLKVDQGINMAGLSQGDTFSDLVGNDKYNYTTIDGSNRVYIEIPPRSYSVWRKDLIPLPVELTSFTSVIVNGKVKLNWKTVSEKNNYGFEIQRSQKTGVSSQNENIGWEKVGFVKGNGNSNSPREYSFTDISLTGNGKYTYRLKQVDSDGSFKYSNTTEISINSIIEYSVKQNYPNPFNPATTLEFSIPKEEHVSLIIYNSLGEQVDVLINKIMPAGSHKINYKAKNINSGVYFYKIQAGEYSQVKSMILIK